MEVETLRPLLKKYNIEDVADIIKGYLMDVYVIPPPSYRAKHVKEDYKNKRLNYSFWSHKMLCKTEFNLFKEEIKKIVKKNNLFENDNRTRFFFKNKYKIYYFQLDIYRCNYMRTDYHIAIYFNN